jgi:high-affinity K+ transport system ATPase subunit B
VEDLKAASAQSGNEAVDMLAGADGLAEVYPEDKYIVVRHLQAAGHVTGMTGDGVNDAPALRQCSLHLQFPDAALLCRIFYRLCAGAALVLGDDAQ